MDCIIPITMDLKKVKNTLFLIKMWEPVILERLNRLEGEIFKDVIQDVDESIEELTKQTIKKTEE